MKKLSAYEYIHAMSKAAAVALRVKQRVKIKTANMNTAVPQENATNTYTDWSIPKDVFDSDGKLYIPEQKKMPPMPAQVPAFQRNHSFNSEGVRRFGTGRLGVDSSGARKSYKIKSPAEIQRLGQISQYYDSPVAFTDENGEHGGEIYIGRNGQQEFAYDGSPYMYSDKKNGRLGPGARLRPELIPLYATSNYWLEHKWNTENAAQEVPGYSGNLESNPYMQAIDDNYNLFRQCMMGGNYQASRDALYNRLIPSIQEFERDVQRDRDAAGLGPVEAVYPEYEDDSDILTTFQAPPIYREEL